jgi:hypothetical protein
VETDQHEEPDLERLDALHLAAARKCLDHWYRNAAGFKVDPPDVPKLQATFPVVAHTLNQVEAALVLRERGLAYPAMANVRVAFEHALIAQWVVHTHGGEEKLVGKMRNHLRNIIDDVKRAGVTLPPEAATPMDKTGELPSVQDIADRFDGKTRNIYSVYRDLTGAVHVSLTTVNAYLDWRGDDAVPGLHLHPKPYEGTYLCLAIGWSAVLALAAIERLRLGHPHLGWIEELAQEHRLVPDLAQSDSRPDLQPRRQPVTLVAEPASEDRTRVAPSAGRHAAGMALPATDDDRAVRRPAGHDPGHHEPSTGGRLRRQTVSAVRDP